MSASLGSMQPFVAQLEREVYRIGLHPVAEEYLAWRLRAIRSVIDDPVAVIGIMCARSARSALRSFSITPRTTRPCRGVRLIVFARLIIIAAKPSASRRAAHERRSKQ